MFIFSIFTKVFTLIENEINKNKLYFKKGVKTFKNTIILTSQLVHNQCF